MKRGLINDLYDRAHVVHEIPYEGSVVDPTIIAIHKQKVWDRYLFAELIIKRIIENVECHADMYDTPDTRFICEKIVNSVKFDFGVDE